VQRAIFRLIFISVNAVTVLIRWLSATIWWWHSVSDAYVQKEWTEWTRWKTSL